MGQSASGQQRAGSAGNSQSVNIKTETQSWYTSQSQLGIHHSYRDEHTTQINYKMSLWKVMTMPMSQVARQSSAQEVAQVGKFVWCKEGFKWISDTSAKTPAQTVNTAASESGANMFSGYDVSSGQHQSHSVRQQL